jgi:lipoate-protein ligase A
MIQNALQLSELVILDQRDRPAGGPWNMAMDEILLSDGGGRAILRLYSWDGPWVSFGFSQKFGEMPRDLKALPAVQWVRRWTGGGVVPHLADATYSLILPQETLLGSLEPVASYAFIHRCLAETLRSGGMAAELEGSEPKSAGLECFTSPVRSDVMVSGRKLSGAAQRRTRFGVLHQGSIQSRDLPAGWEREFALRLARKLVTAAPLDGLEAKASALAEAKYGTDAWLHRRE